MRGEKRGQLLIAVLTLMQCHTALKWPALRVLPSWLYGTAELTRYAEHSCMVTEQLAWKLTFACFLNCGLFISNAFNWSGWLELEPSDIFAFSLPSAVSLKLISNWKNNALQDLGEWPCQESRRNKKKGKKACKFQQELEINRQWLHMQ